ncbi:MAG: hypothetical protein QXJ14_04165 [Candidatus Aenigmatarchaeota archaeon]
MAKKKTGATFIKVISILLLIVGLSLIGLIALLPSSSMEEIELRIRILSVVIGVLYILFSLFALKIGF